MRFSLEPPTSMISCCLRTALHFALTSSALESSRQRVLLRQYYQRWQYRGWRGDCFGPELQPTPALAGNRLDLHISIPDTEVVTDVGYYLRSYYGVLWPCPQSRATKAATPRFERRVEPSSAAGYTFLGRHIQLRGSIQPRQRSGQSPHKHSCGTAVTS